MDHELIGFNARRDNLDHFCQVIATAGVRPTTRCVRTSRWAIVRPSAAIARARGNDPRRCRPSSTPPASMLRASRRWATSSTTACGITPSRSLGGQPAGASSNARARSRCIMRGSCYVLGHDQLAGRKLNEVIKICPSPDGQRTKCHPCLFHGVTYVSSLNKRKASAARQCWLLENEKKIS